jgi:hypothetical protein
VTGPYKGHLEPTAGSRSTAATRGPQPHEPSLVRAVFSRDPAIAAERQTQAIEANVSVNVRGHEKVPTDLRARSSGAQRSFGRSASPPVDRRSLMDTACGDLDVNQVAERAELGAAHLVSRRDRASASAGDEDHPFWIGTDTGWLRFCSCRCAKGPAEPASPGSTLRRQAAPRAPD